MAEVIRVLPNLLPDSRYVVRVRSNNNLGVQSEWSESLTFETMSDESTPSAPTNLVTNFSATAFIVTWTPPTTNTDGSTLMDLKGYKVTLTANSITKVYEVTDAYFLYSRDQNTSDFGSLQSSISVTVKAVDIHGNESAALVGSDSNEDPTDPTDAPILVGVFTGISITMIPPDGLLDYKGFLLEHSLDGSSWSTLADLAGTDTYFHELSDTDTHYYRFKVRDQFDQLSTGYSPVASGTTLETEVSVDNLLEGTWAAKTFIIDTNGFIQSFGYTPSGTPKGYRLSKDGITFQNGAISIVGHNVGGTSAITLDSNKFQIAYSSNTRFYVDGNGIFLNGTSTSNATMYVTSAGAVKFQSPTSGGTHRFEIDPSATGANKYLRLWDGASTDSFYLTADGLAYFRRGVIGLGSSGGFNVDNSGNIWQGNPATSTYATATAFRVSAAGQINTGSGTVFQVTPAGALTATDANITGSFTVSGTLTASAGTVVIDASTGIKLIVGTGNSNKIKWYDLAGSDTEGTIYTTTGGDMYIQADSDIFMEVAGSNRLTISAGGTVDIPGTLTTGTFSPSTVNATSQYQLNGTQIVDSSRNLVNIGTITASGDVTCDELIASTGSISTGNASPTNLPVQARGTGQIAGIALQADSDGTETNTLIIIDEGSSDDNRVQFINYDTGDYANLIGGTYTNGSSIRWKEDLRPIEYSALSKIAELNPTRFRWISQQREDIGFIAEEMFDAIPESVSLDNQGQPEGIAYNIIVTLLVKAVQELQEQVAALQGE